MVSYWLDKDSNNGSGTIVDKNLGNDRLSSRRSLCFLGLCIDVLLSPPSQMLNYEALGTREILQWCSRPLDSGKIDKDYNGICYWTWNNLIGEFLNIQWLLTFIHWALYGAVAELLGRVEKIRMEEGEWSFCLSLPNYTNTLEGGLVGHSFGILPNWPWIFTQRAENVRFVPVDTWFIWT